MPIRTAHQNRRMIEGLTAENARIRTALEQLAEQVSLVLADLSDQDTGWYDPLQAAAPQARTALKGGQ